MKFSSSYDFTLKSMYLDFAVLPPVQVLRFANPILIKSLSGSGDEACSNQISRIRKQQAHCEKDL